VLSSDNEYHDHGRKKGEERIMFELFQKGGPVMYPLLLCSVLTFAYGIERAYHFLRAQTRKETLLEILPLVEGADYGKAKAAAEKARGSVAAVLEEALRNRGKDRTFIEEAVSLKGSHELKRLNRNLHVIELSGRIAPLLGLLGTVLGMVEAFRRVSGAKGAVDPSVLAGGIWEALLTTVAGLCVAIPAIVIHHLFEDRVKATAFEMKHMATEAIALLENKNDRV
jgi:biopolymer transport protein ExbB